MNRNLLILGSAALLVLGGLGFFIASRQSDDTQTTTQNIRNEIINNSYFQNLIATGVTTMQDLKSIADIRPYEEGFIGISADSLAWEDAQELALRTGSEILAPGDDPSGSRTPMLAWVGNVFGPSLSSSVWISEGGEARVLDGADILSSSETNHARRVMLSWSISRSNPINESNRSVLSTKQAEKDLHQKLKASNPSYTGNGKFDFENGRIVGVVLNNCGISDVTPLKGLPLRHLELWESKVRDLSPLFGMRLTRLNIGGCTNVDDLSAIKGMPLESLLMSRTRAADLSPLEGAPLKYLNIWATPVSDLSPLRNSNLEVLDAGQCVSLQDLSPLRQLPLRKLHVNGSYVADLAPLANLRLHELSISDTRVSDLRPLAKCPLMKLRFTIRDIKNGIEEVRAIPTLVRIEEGRSNDIGSADEFWRNFDARRTLLPD